MKMKARIPYRIARTVAPITAKVVALVLLMMLAQVGFAQNMGINRKGLAPHPSAMLDVSDSTRGFLMPRMSTVYMNAISSPADGLMVYVTTDSTFYFYNGVNWTRVGQGWGIDGNAGTDPDIHFMGTTDDQPLNIKVNNTTILKLDYKIAQCV